MSEELTLAQYGQDNINDRGQYVFSESEFNKIKNDIVELCAREADQRGDKLQSSLGNSRHDNEGTYTWFTEGVIKGSRRIANSIRTLKINRNEEK